MTRVHNFSAGPAIMPELVLEQIRDEMMSLPGLGMSVMEISHRSADFGEIHAAAKNNIRELLNVPDEYDILFLQGGSRLQFAMIPMNLGSGQYVVTGTWGKKALEEANLLGSGSAAWNGSSEGFVRFPQDGELDLDPAAQFVHVTSNETIQGVQFATEPNVGDVPLVCDCSSDFMCRPLPTYLNYQIQAKNDSLYNTPPTFAIYCVKLIGDWLRNTVGGLEKMQQTNQEKASLLYDVIDGSDGFFQPHSASDCRSIMNVVFKLPNEDLDNQFINQAAKRQLMNLKGHRSVGGIRASIYNAMSIEGTTALRDFMVEFQQEHQA